MSSLSYNPVNPGYVYTNTEDFLLICDKCSDRVIGSVTVIQDHNIISLCSRNIYFADVDFFKHVMTYPNENISKNDMTYYEGKLTIRNKTPDSYNEITLNTYDTQSLANQIADRYSQFENTIAKYSRFEPGNPDKGGILIIEHYSDRIIEIVLKSYEIDFFKFILNIIEQKQIPPPGTDVNVHSDYHSLYFNYKGLHITTYFQHNDTEDARVSIIDEQCLIRLAKQITVPLSNPSILP